MPPPNTNRVTIRELLTLALYDRVRIAVGAAIPFAIGLVAMIAASSWYESSASMVVLHGGEYLAKSPISATLTNMGLEPKQILSAEAELIDNRNLLLRVINQVGAGKIYPNMESDDQEHLLARLRSDLDIEPVFSAGVLRLSFRNRDPAVARETLSTIISLYIDGRNAAVGDQKTASMAQQAEQMAAKLKEAESALNQFSLEHGISDMANQRSHLLKLRSDLLAGQGAVQSLIVSRRSEIKATALQLQATPATLRESNSNGRIRELENAKASLLTLELRRKDLVTRLSESSEEVANVDLQISTVRSFLATEPDRVQDSSHDSRNPAYDLAQRHLTALTAEIKGLEANVAQATNDVAAIDRQLSALDAQAQSYDRLAEAEHTAEEPLLAYLPKLDELKINEELSRRLSSNVRIIQNATMPTIRRSNRGLYFGFGIFGALIGGLAATFARTSLRQVCVLPSEMEQWLNMRSLLVVSYREVEAAE